MFYLLAFALFLRLILINQSLWLDEAIQALALMGKMGPLLTYALADFQPPLYHFIGWLWTSIFGYSELALRFPSLLAGLGTVYAAAKLGELLGGKKLMYLVGGLAATNPLLIYYSQEGRTYGLTTFFVTAAMYYYILITQKQSNSIQNTTYYILYTTLFLWTSYLTWFLHLILFIYTIIIKRRDLILTQLITGLTLLFWLPSLYQSLQVGLSTVSSSPEWGNVVGGISLKALALTWVKAVIGRISFTPTWVYRLVVALAFALHARIVLAVKSIPLPILLWLGSIPVLALVSLLLPVYSYTRLLFVVPAYLLILSLGLVKLSRSWTYAVISLQLLFLTVFWFNPSFHREDWRGIVASYGPNAVYALPSLNQNAPLLYYGVLSGQIIEPKVLSTLPIFPSHIIYIRYVENVFDVTRAGIVKLSALGYSLEAQQVYPGLQVDIYENNN